MKDNQFDKFLKQNAQKVPPASPREWTNILNVIEAHKTLGEIVQELFTSRAFWWATLASSACAIVLTVQLNYSDYGVDKVSEVLTTSQNLYTDISLTDADFLE